MNAPAQLTMFEPDGAEAVALLQMHMKEADRLRSAAERLRLCGIDSGAALLSRLAESSERDALVFAILLDIEREAGL